MDLERFTSRYTTAWSECDTGLLAELVTDDVVWEDPALTGPARGVAAVQEFMRAGFRAFPDLRFGEPDPPHRTVEGDRVAWAWWMEGTMRGHLDPPGFAPTGAGFHVEGVDLWTMRDGRIAGHRAFYDLNDMARQLRIAPAPGSRAERAAVLVQRLQARLARA